MVSYFITAGFSVVTGILIYVVQNLLKENNRLKYERRKNEQARHHAVEEGVLSLLRMQMFEYYNKYMKNEDIPSDVYENWEDMFDAYTMLGGNGTIRKMNADIKNKKLELEE